MENKEKWEEEDKKEIEKRLRLSNKGKWSTLTPKERKAVINKYYNLRGIEHRGIDKVLDDNRDMRRNFTFLFLGLLLGICGNLFADILIQYSPKNSLLNFGLLAFFAFFFWRIVKLMETMSAEHLYQEDILDHLLELTKEDELEKS